MGGGRHKASVQLKVATWGGVSNHVDQRRVLVEVSGFDVCWPLNRQYTLHMDPTLRQHTTILDVTHTQCLV